MEGIESRLAYVSANIIIMHYNDILTHDSTVYLQAATHGLLYVLPSLPHTGSYIIGHTHPLSHSPSWDIVTSLKESCSECFTFSLETEVLTLFNIRQHILITYIQLHINYCKFFHRFHIQDLYMLDNCNLHRKVLRSIQ